MIAISFLEAMHPRHDALAVEPEHTPHPHYESVVRIVDAAYVDASSGRALVEGDYLPWLDTARRTFQQSLVPTLYAPWLTSGDELPLIGNITAEWA